MAESGNINSSNKMLERDKRILERAIDWLEKDALIMQQLSTEEIAVITPTRKEILERLAKLSLKSVTELKTLLANGK